MNHLEAQMRIRHWMNTHGLERWKIDVRRGCPWPFAIDCFIREKTLVFAAEYLDRAHHYEDTPYDLTSMTIHLIAHARTGNSKHRAPWRELAGKMGCAHAGSYQPPTRWMIRTARRWWQNRY